MKTITLPWCLPWILTGMRMALAWSIGAAVVGEYLAAQSGLGYRINAYAGVLNQTGRAGWLRGVADRQRGPVRRARSCRAPPAALEAAGMSGDAVAVVVVEKWCRPEQFGTERTPRSLLPGRFQLGLDPGRENVVVRTVRKRHVQWVRGMSTRRIARTLTLEDA